VFYVILRRLATGQNLDEEHYEDTGHAPLGGPADPLVHLPPVGE